MFSRISNLELPRFSPRLPSRLSSLTHRASSAASARPATGPSGTGRDRSSSVEPGRLSEGHSSSSRSSSTEPDARQPRLPASARAANSLPQVKVTAYDIEQNNNDVCVVCIDELSVDSMVTRMPCGHIFHRQCIIAWLKKCNQCPVCRYELATDDRAYEKHRIHHMESRKLRLHLSDLNAKGVNEIIRLAEHVQVNLSGCPSKRDLIERIASSPFVEIVENPPGFGHLDTDERSTAAKLIASRQELVARLACHNARLDCHMCSKPTSPQAVGSIGDLAGDIMAELRQTAARLDFQLNDCTGSANAPLQHRGSFSSVGQSIVGTLVH